MSSLLEDDRRSATFGPDRAYRYRLRRTWNPRRPACLFVMLNPSTADETRLDPTCRRCVDYAERWGYGTLLVGNLFALCSTNPSQLYEHDDPVGSENDEHLQALAGKADRVVFAWGHHGDLYDRASEVARLLEDQDAVCLGTTQEGQPVHPLRQPADARPVLFEEVAP